jgi:hypothetical protein
MLLDYQLNLNLLFHLVELMNCYRLKNRQDMYRWDNGYAIEHYRATDGGQLAVSQYTRFRKVSHFGYRASFS